jgi:hypothetical protein
VPYTFLRRLFGEDVHATAYKYGLAYFEAPFYAIGKGLSAAGVGTIAGQPTPPALIALGAAVYVGIAVALAVMVVRELGLPYPTFSAGVTLFGTAAFFYGAFDPGQTHAVDVLLATVVVAAALRGFRNGWPDRVAVLVGVAVGLAASIRYFTGVTLLALAVVWLFQRRFRPLLVAAASTAVTFALAAVPPVVVGLSPLHSGYGQELLSWSPLSPPRMLFTDERGLFVWTPLTLLAFVGLARLLVVRRRDRAFIVFLALTAVLTIASYAFVSFWDAGYSFSERYFTPLFSVYVVGVAGLFEWRPRVVPAVAVVAAAWSTLLGLSLNAAYPFTAAPYSATVVARYAFHNSPGEFVTALASRAPILRRLGF